MTDLPRILEATGQALGLAGQLADLADRLRRTPERRAAGLRRRARRRRRAAARALTSGGRRRKLERAADLEADAAELDQLSKVPA